MRRLAVMFSTLLAVGTLARAGDRTSDFGAVVRAFSVARHTLARELSAQLNLPLPAQAEAFFRAAETGRWESVSNGFEQVKEAGDLGRAMPDLRNELWAPIHETLGIWEVWVGWHEDPALLALFHEPVMASMPKGSVYFGGTDYGRFVITAVNALRDPPPVFCITQNALADTTYAAHLRALHGERIWLPKEGESTQAFQRYVQEVQAGQRPGDGDLKIVDGRVRVSGVRGVMAINGILCRMIFDHNKAGHDFFVEESYVIDWMYPHLEPHGLIMRLNREPLARIPDEAVARDRDFWKRHEERLNAVPGFATNAAAREAFAKLRSAIAGLYAYRNMNGEAEAAFEQAIRLCPASPEANFRLAETHQKQGQAEEALAVLCRYLEHAAPDQRYKAESYVRQLEERVREAGAKPVR